MTHDNRRGSTLTLRPERPADHEAVFEVNRLAFGGADEARLVQALRLSPAFIPELSLVDIGTLVERADLTPG